MTTGEVMAPVFEEGESFLFNRQYVTLLGAASLMRYDAWSAGETLYHGTPKLAQELHGWRTGTGSRRAELVPMQPYQWLGDPVVAEPFGRPAVCMTPHPKFSVIKSLLHHDNPILQQRNITRETSAINTSITTKTGSFAASGYQTVRALFEAQAITKRPVGATVPGLDATVFLIEKKWGTPVKNRDPDEYRAYIPIPIKGECTVTPLDLPDELILMHGGRDRYHAFLQAAQEVEGGYDALREKASEMEFGIVQLGEVRNNWL